MTNNIKHLFTCWFVICVSLWLAVQGFCPLQKLQIISCSSVTLPAFCVVSVLDFGHFNWYVVVSHWFNLYFPNDIWCGASFHMLICHLYIFFFFFFSNICYIYRAFPQCGTSGAGEITNSGGKPCCTPYICKVSLQCGSSDAESGLNLNWSFSHTPYIRTASPQCEFAHGWRGHSFDWRLVHIPGKGMVSPQCGSSGAVTFLSCIWRLCHILCICRASCPCEFSDAGESLNVGWNICHTHHNYKIPVL